MTTENIDDVREALIAALDDTSNCWTYNGTHTVFSPSRGADAILGAFDVRPRGTVPPSPNDIRECTICGERVNASNATPEWESQHTHSEVH